ncbi:hypothetical protein MTR67_018665 [Solanum verrucosum]|uniref:Uncharacterized protein n=1 Tax=Solanum verrucosum TaxID=315347 RepID=A0AAF0QMR9_SOLVR|nr:hypothetical protein MTR67_018665 [Solanum verrucosum]
MASNIHSLGNQTIRLDICESDRVIACIEARSSSMEKFLAQWFKDLRLTVIQDKVLSSEARNVILYLEGSLRIEGRIRVARVCELVESILEKSHCSRYSVHPGSMKMYRDLKIYY